MHKRAAPGVQTKLATAVQHHQAGRLHEAEQLYREVLLAEPHHAEALHMRGLLAHQTGRRDLALDLIGQAIGQRGQVPGFHHNRGVILSEMGRHEDAVAAYRRALALNPQFVEAHYNLGVGLQFLGRYDEAEACYGRATALKPDHADAYANLGLIRAEQGRLDDAVSLYERALEYQPNHAETHCNLGGALQQLGRGDSALACYRRALELKPDLVQAHDNIGIILLERGLPAEALQHFERALALRPDHPPAHGHRGNALKELGEPIEAAAAYRRALALAPDDPDARLGLAIAAIPLVADTVSAGDAAIGAFERALDELAAWSMAHPGMLGNAVGRNLPFYLAYRPGDVGVALARFGDLMCAAAATRWPATATRGGAARPTGGRVRLAIVSGHVRRHPVWDIVLRGIVAHLDRRHIHITLYHTGSATDGETLWAGTQVDRLVQGPKSMQFWLDEIAHDLPDVLFYPEVGMDPITCALAALRLAPVQMAGWGHPVTTGLPTMDLYLSADLLEGPGAAAHYRERLVRLPGTGVCTAMAPGPSTRWEAPARPARVVRFTLCQQPIKFDPADDALIACIAKLAAPCEFWLPTPEKLNWASSRVHGRLAAALRTEGLDPDSHLRVMPWLPRDQFLGFLDEMDIYLDCPAFSGYTTAWQAVHRGLPIVTYEGRFLRQRLAGGLLRQIGLTNLIASSREHYVEKAVSLAEECRERPGARDARRSMIRGAASQADGNLEAVSAFQRIVLESRRSAG